MEKKKRIKSVPDADSPRTQTGKKTVKAKKINKTPAAPVIPVENVTEPTDNIVTNTPHLINDDNIDDFVLELKGLLDKYHAHSDDSFMEINTSNLSLTVTNWGTCPPACRRSRQVCDINGRNCVIEYWCDCSGI